MANTTSSLLYPDSLAPPTSARGVSNPTTTKVITPATTTQTTAVPVSRPDVQITLRPDAEVFRRRRPAIHVDGRSMGQRVSPKTQSGKTADHQQLSVCTSRRKCSNCRKLLEGRKQQQEHRCG